MAREMVIPPIRKNPRLGKETESDASVMFGGAQLPKEKREKEVKEKRRVKRRTRQRNFTIRNEDQLRQLVERLGISAAAVVNLGIARLAKEYI
jgi:hypothetical protein